MYTIMKNRCEKKEKDGGITEKKKEREKKKREKRKKIWKEKESAKRKKYEMMFSLNESEDGNEFAPSRLTPNDP